MYLQIDGFGLSLGVFEHEVMLDVLVFGRPIGAQFAFVPGSFRHSVLRQVLLHVKVGRLKIVDLLKYLRPSIRKKCFHKIIEDEGSIEKIR